MACQHEKARRLYISELRLWLAALRRLGCGGGDGRHGGRAESRLLERLDAGSEQRAIALSPDGRLFATGGADHAVHLWDFDNAMLLARGGGHSGTVRDLMFSPDGKQLVSVADDKNVLIRNVYPDAGGGGGGG